MNPYRITASELASVIDSDYEAPVDSYQCDDCGIVAPFLSDAQRYAISIQGFGLCVRCFKADKVAAVRDALVATDRAARARD